MKASQQGTNLRFKGIPRQGTLLNKSVMDTLYYCCLYHYDLGEVCGAESMNDLRFVDFWIQV